jgi:CubicO group peptidase (beta-lactamase class C family)
MSTILKGSPVARIVFVGFLSLCIRCSSPTQQEVREHAEFGSPFHSYFTALTELKQFNGVVLVFDGDHIIHERAYNIDPHSTAAVSISSQFDIHSISKLMTKHLVFELESTQKLNADLPLDAYFSDFPNGEFITLQMLLNHTSGLPREFENSAKDEIDLEPYEIVAEAQRQHLLFQPGTSVQYSNVGYELVHNIVAITLAKPFAQCIVDHVFEPMQMQQSGAHLDAPSHNLLHWAQNHVMRDSLLIQVPNIQNDEFRTARLYCTARDLMRFLLTVDASATADSLMNQEGIIAKDGGATGARAQVYLDRNSKKGFVLLANYDGMPFTQVIKDMISLLNHEPVALPKALQRRAISLYPSTLTAYAAEYSFADFGGLILNISPCEGQLCVYQEGEMIATLKAESPTVFFADPKAPESFEFIPNGHGVYDVLMGWNGVAVKGIRNDSAHRNQSL